MSNKDSVFLVIDGRFGVVFASLSVDEAVADLNKRVLAEAACTTLGNPGSFRIKSMKLGSQDTLTSPTEDKSGEDTAPHDDHAAAIARDVHLGRSSQEIRDEIIAQVGMMAAARTPEMQARYDAVVERERVPRPECAANLANSARVPREEIASAKHGSIPFLTDHQRYSLRCIRDFARPCLATAAPDDQNRCDPGLSWLDDLLDGTGATGARKNSKTLSAEQRRLLVQFQEACRVIGAHDDGARWQMLGCAIEAELAALDVIVVSGPLNVAAVTASRAWHRAELEKYLARPDACRGAAGTEDALRALLAVGTHACERSAAQERSTGGSSSLSDEHRIALEAWDGAHFDSVHAALGVIDSGGELLLEPEHRRRIEAWVTRPWRSGQRREIDAALLALLAAIDGLQGLRSKRVSTGLPALNRVLGGGLIEGSTILLVGQPVTGKTTLTLQMLDGLGQRCLYVTSEETIEQVKAIARRIGAVSDQICMLAERRLGEILERARSMRAQVVAIDTIQTLICEHVSSRPGLPAQLRACMKRLIDYHRSTGTTLWLVDYLASRGDVAGPRTIEHDVDVVLRLDQEDAVRILSCPDKNRFGPTNAVGRLELTARGLVGADKEVSSPYEAS